MDVSYEFHDVATNIMDECNDIVFFFHPHFFSFSFFFVVKNDFNETWKNLKIVFWTQKPKSIVTTWIVTINPDWMIYELTNSMN